MITMIVSATFAIWVDKFSGNINKVVVVLAGFAFVVFVYGVVKFIYKAGDEKAREEGKSAITWGIIIFFVMVSVWGLVNLITSSVKLDSDKLNIDDVKNLNR